MYKDNICCLQRDTLWKLSKANDELKNKGYKIKIWDAYRPLSIQKIMWDMYPDDKYVANPYKGGSNHNKGCAVDITLINKNGKEVKMPSDFDDFSIKASRSDSNMSQEAKRNLEILTNAMVNNGFTTIDSEWWHFEDSESYKYDALDISLKTIANTKLPVQNLSGLNDSKQVILVTTNYQKSYKAKLSCFEKVGNLWKELLPKMGANIGKNGLKPTKDSKIEESEKNQFKYEGDMCSPIGIFSIDTLFGWGDNQNFKLPYKKVTNDDYWISENEKDSYNIWIHREGGPDKDWTNFEYMKIDPYKYGAIINYNMDGNKVVGNGSGIFLHVKGKNDYTSGCTALSEDDLIKVLKWLSPEKRPLIVQNVEYK